MGNKYVQEDTPGSYDIIWLQICPFMPFMLQGTETKSAYYKNAQGYKEGQETVLTAE